MLTSARGDLEYVLSLYRELGDRQGEAGALDSLGLLHHRLGRTGEAAAYYRRALAAFRELGDGDGETGALEGLTASAEASPLVAAESPPGQRGENH